MQKILVDTNILIDFSFGKSKELENLLNLQESGQVELYINPIVTAEFLNNRLLNNEQKYNVALSFLNIFSNIQINQRAAIIAGELLRTGQCDYLADAFIAATAISEKMSLLTNNQKHFMNVQGLNFS